MCGVASESKTFSYSVYKYVFDAYLLTQFGESDYFVVLIHYDKLF